MHLLNPELLKLNSSLSTATRRHRALDSSTCIWRCAQGAPVRIILAILKKKFWRRNVREKCTGWFKLCCFSAVVDGSCNGTNKGILALLDGGRRETMGRPKEATTFERWAASPIVCQWIYRETSPKCLIMSGRGSPEQNRRGVCHHCRSLSWMLPESY